MTFILKEGLIHIVGNHGFPNNNIEGTVVSEGLEGYTLSFSVNNKEYQPLKDKITITKEEMKNTSIRIIVRAIKGRDILYFKSDIIPLTHAVWRMWNRLLVWKGRKQKTHYTKICSTL
jgi:hypothetical protein